MRDNAWCLPCGAAEDAVEKAIRFERDPINQARVRVLQAMQNTQPAEALRLNAEYLRERPNDQIAQSYQLVLLSDLGAIDELRAAIEEFERRDGYDLLVNNDSITAAMLTGDKEFVQRFAHDALRRMPERPFIQYQSHRSLLFCGRYRRCSYADTRHTGQRHAGTNADNHPAAPGLCRGQAR